MIVAAGALSALVATLTLAQSGNDPYAPRRLPPAAVPDRSTTADRIDRIPSRPRPRPDGPPAAESVRADSASDELSDSVVADEKATAGGAIAVPEARPENSVEDAIAEDEGDEAEGEDDEDRGDEDEPEIDVSKIRRPAFDPEVARTCERNLLTLRVQFEVLDPLEEDDDPVCGHPRPLKVRSIDGVKLQPAPTMRCEVAVATALWMTNVVVPSAKLHLDAKPTVLGTTGSYQCRKRRSASTDRYSEHAFANALDIAGLSFARRDRIRIEERRNSADASRAFQAAIRGGACGYFTTVIGPMTNQAHADHLHLDLAERRGGYRLCQ